MPLEKAYQCKSISDTVEQPHRERESYSYTLSWLFGRRVQNQNKNTRGIGGLAKNTPKHQIEKELVNYVNVFVNEMAEKTRFLLNEHDVYTQRIDACTRTFMQTPA